MVKMYRKKDLSDEKRYVCDRCGYASNKKCNLVQHIAAQHENVRHQCKECEFNSLYLHKLKKHIQVVHERILLSCNVCDFKTETESALRTHKKTTHSVRNFSCDQCEFKTVYEHTLKTHQRIKHEGLKYACNLCDYKGGTIYALKDHKKIVHENFKLQCDLCKFTTSRQGNLNVHKKAVHSDNKNKVFCDKCSYSSNYASALKRHMKVKHGGIKSECEYKAVKKDDLQNLVQVDSDLVDENSNVLKHAYEVEDVNSQQSGTSRFTSSKSEVFSPDTQGGSRCSSSLETKDPPMCKPCGYNLEPDETLDEHIVSVHLTAEGLCDICGENSKDFLEHFQIHIGKLEDRFTEHPMVQIKIEMVNGLDCHMKIAEDVFEGNPLYG